MINRFGREVPVSAAKMISWLSAYRGLVAACAMSVVLGATAWTLGSRGADAPAANTSGTRMSSPPRAGGVRDAVQTLLAAHEWGAAEAVRARIDAARRRLWVLTLDHVYVYDMHTLARIGSFELPSGSMAAFNCPPDLVLNESGVVFVSNNVLPILVEIDLTAERIREHRLTTVSPKQWEVGFGRLAFRPDGMLIAVSAAGRTLWHIDVGAGVAHELPSATESVPDCTVHDLA